MNKSNKLLSDLSSFKSYAKYRPDVLRRESLEETINREMQMHLSKFGSLSQSLSKDIIKTFQYVHELKLMPSMRGMQFAGKAIEQNNVRQYNCSFLNIDSINAFGESLFLLLSGTGVGYSVQKHHITHLPSIQRPREEGTYVVHDSIIGWAQAVDMLFEAYMYGRMRPVFDFSKIRPKGSYLVTTGAKAPGSEPLRKMLVEVENRLAKAVGRKLTSIEVHDIICIISDCVLSGGIRRAALICLFDHDDNEMLTCKTGDWYESHPYRARANNSAILSRDINFKKFKEIFDVTRNSGSGEPGFSWSDDFDMGFNPCFTGETLLKTESGFQPIASLKDKNLKLYNVNNELVDGSVWSNGIKDVVKIKFSSNEFIRCTPDHRFMLNNGEECLAKDLKGQRIMPNISLNTKDCEFTKLGFIQGDGNLCRLNSSTHKGLELNIGDKDLDIANLFNVNFEDGKRSYYVTEYNEICKDLKFDPSPLPTRAFPSTYSSWTLEQKRGFLRGLYSANGSIIKAGRVSFKGTCLELIEELKDSLLNDFGIASYVTTNKPKEIKFNNGSYMCKQSYDLNIGQFQNIVKFAKKIAFVHKYKNDSLVNIIKEKSPLVLSVKDDGKEEVFDFNLQDDTHWGVVSQDADNCGYIAHNCHEVSLNSTQFCNLTTINMSTVKSKADFLKRAHGAALLGTLQAAYTDFPYLRPQWREITEREALIGCSITGIADYGKVPNDWLRDGAKLIKELNEKYAKKIGINPAARCTTLKPEGTSSCVLGSSSGIHDRHSEYYIRRIRMNKDDSLYKYLQTCVPDLCEDDLFSTGGVVSIPQMSPSGAITREQSSAINLLDRAMKFNRHWVAPGHRSGNNKNNVSCTVSVKEEEWEDVCQYMYDKRSVYSGIALLPYDGGTYKQAPFEEIDEKAFKEMNKKIGKIDLTEVMEVEDNTNRAEIIACSGGKCDII